MPRNPKVWEPKLLAHPALLNMPLDKLISTDKEPEADLIHSIRERDVQVPIRCEVFEEEGEVKVKVIAGNRRANACRLLVEQGDRQKNFIPAIVGPESDQTDQWTMTLIENLVRQDNPIAEVEAIEGLHKAGLDAAEISASTGVALAKVKQRLNLVENLQPEAMERLKDGTMTFGAAKRLTLLEPDRQKAVVEEDEGRISVRDVEVAVRQQRQQQLSLDLVNVPTFQADDALAQQVENAAVNRANEQERKTLLAAAEILRKLAPEGGA